MGSTLMSCLFRIDSNSTYEGERSLASYVNDKWKRPNAVFHKTFSQDTVVIHT